MLREQIEKDYIDAFKSRNEFLVSSLRMLKAAMINAAIEKYKKTLDTDEEVIEIVKREMKKLRDALIDFTKAGRADLIEKTQKEIVILEKYLPAAASEEQIKEVVKKVIDEIQPSGQSDFGKVMGVAMKELKGAADGNAVKKAVEELLGE